MEVRMDLPGGPWRPFRVSPNLTQARIWAYS